MSKVRVGIAMAGLGLAAAIANTAVGRPVEAPNDPPRVLGESCALGADLERRLTLTLQVRARGEALGLRDEMLRVDLRVQARPGGLAFVVEEVEVEGATALAEENAVGAAWAVDLREDCAIERFGVAADAPADVVGLARTVAMVLNASVRSEGTWESAEPDALGVAHSEYRRSGRLISRARRGHERVHGEPEIRVAEFRADATFELAASGWLASAEFEESGTVLVLGQPVELSTRGGMRSEDAPRGTSIPLAETLAWSRLDAPPEPSAATPSELETAASVGGTGALLSDGGVTDVPAALAMDMANALAERVRREPDRAEQVLERIREPRSAMTAEVRAALFFALELAGTEAAQAALRRVLTATEEREADHLHAIVALHGVRSPVPESFLLLEALVRDDGLEGPRGRAALLALATWASRDRSEVERSARAVVREAIDPLLRNDPSLALAAVQNLGAGGGYDPEVLSLLSAEDHRVRRAAVDASRVLPGPVAWEALGQRLSEETADEVAGAILQRLMGLVGDSGVTPSEPDIERARPFLASSDRVAREAAVDFVGALAPRVPSARGVLIASFRAERDPVTRRRLGRYLNARDLAAEGETTTTASPEGGR
jgi:hypothetical protein